MENKISTSNVKVGSDRSFGIVFSGFFSLIAAFLFWNKNANFIYLLSCALIFGLISLGAPKYLHPLNILWFKFGGFLHMIVSPIILGLMFFSVITPIGLIMRILGKRTLNLQFNEKITTYWINRNPPTQSSNSFKNQF
jgi:hypothetical protein